MFALMLLLLTQVQAESLAPIVLRAPLEEGVVEAECSRAFAQALMDKETYESRPEINMFCAKRLTRDQMETLRWGFLNNCRRTLTTRERGVPPGQDVQLDLAALKVAFNAEYGPIMGSICLPRALKEFYVKQAQERAAHGAESSTAGYCDGVSCQAPVAR